MSDLTPEEIGRLHELLGEEIREFGFTQDVTPTDWLELEHAAVAKVREKVLEFERGRGASLNSLVGMVNYGENGAYPERK